MSFTDEQVKQILERIEKELSIKGIKKYTNSKEQDYRKQKILTRLKAYKETYNSNNGCY